MHRWFFADEPLICKEPRPSSPPTLLSPPRTPSPSFPDTSWTFWVKFKGKLCVNETLAVCGSAEVLGKWNVQHCLTLNRVEGSSLWTVAVTLSRKYDVSYRYLICTNKECGRQRIVRFWETHKLPRLIRSEDVQDLESEAYDIFGLKNGVHKVQRGWISGDTKVVQFKFYKAPFMYTGKSMEMKQLLQYVKITPIKVKPREKCVMDLAPKLNCTSSIESQVVPTEGQPDQESQVEPTEGKPDQALKTAFAFCEVASLAEQEGGFHRQPKYGTSCGPEEMLIFHLTLDDVENTAYLIDLYNYPPKPASDIPPYHFGYQYVMSQQLKGSEGTLKINIMCATKHRSIGSMKCDYLLVKPLPSPHNFNLKESYKFQVKELPLAIGHCGCGKSFWLQDNILRENTVNSFNMAFEHGADMAEFDVHLTQDRIPIVYHDFQFYISRKMNRNKEEFDIFKLSLDAEEINYLKPFGRVLETDLICLPVSKFTLAQLRRVQVYEIPEDTPRSTPCKQNTNLNMPFPTLKHVLKKISPKMGFNIEIKWSQKYTNGNWEEYFTPNMDKNEYVDAILDVVLTMAGSRHIIFSSFDADICTMMRLKQNRYPIMFICNANICEPKYVDPRGDTLLTSSYFAYVMELLGIIADAGDILNSQGQISNLHKRNIRIFAWGPDTRFENNRKSLKGVGVDGVIFDRVNHVLDVEDLKQNILLIELRERDLNTSEILKSLK